MPTGNGCWAGGPRDASWSHTSRSGCGWRPGDRTPYGGQCPLPEPHSPLPRNPPENGPSEQMSLTQRSGRWLAGNHSGCYGGGDGAGDSEELGVG
ncbi:hypothetical protein E2C01_090649 [Portunus trituberculatus]|uniref:Uncharacterized protein n=1 Tax=Portunus trituberculatus TaxID=210409 RepID=A0A5B7JQN8_PORTR|nr:hypothetical protein [Portunus trituberculatus]